MNQPECSSSCLYHGHVVHTRHAPFHHTFRYGLFLVYLDLSELHAAFARHWLWSTQRPNIAWFRRSDHLGHPDVPLDAGVRVLVREQTGRDVSGPIRLLTHLRYFGYLMNPVSFYFCFDESGTRLEAVVAEVTNTPWGERHCYVIEGPGDQAGVLRSIHGKQFHVSPFLPMDLDYRWQIAPPTDTLAITIANERTGQRVFDAALTLQRRPITSFNLFRALIGHPLMTARVSAAIYWQALSLWRRGAPFYPHPKHVEHEFDREDRRVEPGGQRRHRNSIRESQIR